MEDDKKTTASAEMLLMDVMEVFMETFIPGSRDESDEQMTTSEICDHFEDISGYAPEKSLMVQYLKENGYQFSWSDSGFKWLLKFKT